MMERGILLSLAQGAADVCWYTSQNGDNPSNVEDNFGLLNDDGSWSASAETFISPSQKTEMGSKMACIGDLPESLWGEMGNAFWRSGTICGAKVDNKVTWILKAK